MLPEIVASSSTNLTINNSSHWYRFLLWYITRPHNKIGHSLESVCQWKTHAQNPRKFSPHTRPQVFANRSCVRIPFKDITSRPCPSSLGAQTWVLVSLSQDVPSCWCTSTLPIWSAAELPRAIIWLSLSTPSPMDFGSAVLGTSLQSSTLPQNLRWKPQPTAELNLWRSIVSSRAIVISFLPDQFPTLSFLLQVRRKKKSVFVTSLNMAYSTKMLRFRVPCRFSHCPFLSCYRLWCFSLKGPRLRSSQSLSIS